MKPRIFLCSRIPEAAERYLKDRARLKIHSKEEGITRRELLRAVRDVEGLIPTVTEPVDAAVMEAAPRLRVIANYGVGFNNIDVAAATERGLPVTNTPEVLTETTADLAFALMLAAARRLVEGDRLVRSGKWKLWKPTHMLGLDVHGKTLGLIGLGRIGTAVARRARGFRMKVIYSDVVRAPARVEKELGVRRVNLATLLRRSDFISIHALLVPQTHHLIGAPEFEQMKRTAILVNAARGPIVDERALVRALRSRKIAAAGLDVYEGEPRLAPGLARLDNVVLLPHIGSASHETRTAMGMVAARNCLAALAGRRPPNLVNPEVWPRRKRG